MREVPFPDSIQALIAARLDTLPADRKSLLQDAAVIGKVFWVGAVCAMGDRDPGEVELAMHELARKELVRPARQSSMQDEHEFGFWHILVRDVAYAQIPRAQRATKHVQAATWLEEKAGERVEDLAEVLAYHTGEALELATTTGNTTLTDEVTPQARRYALLAGERALGLDAGNALQLLDRRSHSPPRTTPTSGCARTVGPGRPRVRQVERRGGEDARAGGRSSSPTRRPRSCIPDARHPCGDPSAFSATPPRSRRPRKRLRSPRRCHPVR